MVTPRGSMHRVMNHPSLNPIGGPRLNIAQYMTTDDAARITRLTSMIVNVMMNGANGMRAVAGNMITTFVP